MGFISLSLVLPLALVLHPACAATHTSSRSATNTHAHAHAHAHASVRSLRSAASASTRHHHKNRHLTSTTHTTTTTSPHSDDVVYNDDGNATTYYDDDADWTYDENGFVVSFFSVQMGAYSITFSVLEEDLTNGGFYDSWTWNHIGDSVQVCPVSGHENHAAVSGPACITSEWLTEENGRWICRHLYNVLTGEPRTITLCADPSEILASPIDECGCCHGICPEVCTCACTTDAGLDGVRILWNETTFVDSDYYNNTSGPYEECLDQRFVTSVLARGGDIMSCQTDCSASESYEWRDDFYSNYYDDWYYDYDSDDYDDDANADDGSNNNNNRKLKRQNISRRTNMKKGSRRTNTHPKNFLSKP